MVETKVKLMWSAIILAVMLPWIVFFLEPQPKEIIDRIERVEENLSIANKRLEVYLEQNQILLKDNRELMQATKAMLQRPE